MLRWISRSSPIAAASFVLAYASAAWAVDVQVEPGAYVGSYRVDGVTRTGAATIDLAPGAHALRVGSGTFAFDVDAGGNVSTSSPAATGGAGVLSLVTSTIDLEPGAPYLSVGISGVAANAPGARSIVLVRGLDYHLVLGGAQLPFSLDAAGDVVSTHPGVLDDGTTLELLLTDVVIDPVAFTGTWFVGGTSLGARSAVTALEWPLGTPFFIDFGLELVGFDVDASGFVTVPNGVSGVGGQGSLAFATRSVLVDVVDYPGSWSVQRVSGNLTVPSRSFELVPGTAWSFAAGGDTFSFRVDGAGVTSMMGGRTSATPGAGALTLRTAPVTIDPGGYLFNWGIVSFGGYVQGARTFPLIRDFRSFVTVGGGGPATFSFRVDDAGLVTSNAPASAIGGDGRLDFQNVDVVIDSGGFAGVWAVNGIASGSPGVPLALTLVPGLGYTLVAGAQQTPFSVASPCAVSPATIATSTTSFELACGAPDADGDGVPDGEDVCPGADDGIDGDGDGAPDGCDVCPGDALDDEDGDGVCADLDPCPEDAENDADDDGVCGDADTCPWGADAHDRDGDGTPDACDACPDDPANDADDDGFCEHDDVCPTVSDCTQGDADGDGVGDACETDDDGDGIIDDHDVCPFDADPDQADGDRDGRGDVCDLDSDRDGVDDAGDACPGTNRRDMVLANGCSVAQTCACDADWKTDRAYFQCVSDAVAALPGPKPLHPWKRWRTLERARAAACGKRAGWLARD